MAYSKTSQQLLIQSLKNCNLLRHTTALAKIGIRGHRDVLCFDAEFLSSASGIDIVDARHIINTVRDLPAQSAQHPQIPFIKQEPMDNDSDIEIISCKIPSSNSSQVRPHVQSQPIQQMIQTDNERVNADATTNNIHITDAMQVNSNNMHHLLPQSLAPSTSLDRIPHNTVNTQYDDAVNSMNTCPQCYKAFENQELFCAHLLASMQNNGCNADTTASQTSAPSIPSPSLSLPPVNVCIDSMLSQQSHVSVEHNDEDTQMDLNTEQMAHEVMNNETNGSWKCKEIQKVKRKGKRHTNCNVGDDAISEFETTNNKETPKGDDIKTNTDHESKAHSAQPLSFSKRNRGVMCHGCNQKFANLYLKNKHECSMTEISVSPPPLITPVDDYDIDTDRFQCLVCGKSFKNGKALGGHRSGSKTCGNKRKTNKKCKKERTKVKNEYTPMDDTARKRSKRKKSYYTATYTNKDGSQRAPRLRLDDALEDTELQTDWSPVRKKAWANRETHPEGYYYRFNDCDEGTRNGKWDEEEHELFVKRAKEIGVNSKWGRFSQAIPGRVGYICSNYWRCLIRRKIARDQNYYYNDKKGTLLFKWRTNKGSNDELIEVKKWSFALLDEDGNVAYTKERDNFETIEAKFSKYLAEEYVEHMQQPPKKKRKIS
eukprot:412487_1